MAKFDLKSFDQRYFDRLKDFVNQAGKRGILVELVLFGTLYDDKLWDVSPMKASNNLQGIGKVGREQVYALQEQALNDVQDAFVKKVVTELNGLDNLYFEVCNEPYFAGVRAQWQDHIIDTIVSTEKDLPARHLIAQNIANGLKKIDKPNPAVSIFNFHYATPPDAIAVNYGLNKVCADDETGFRGAGDLPYRLEGWDFILAGGAVYSNLDYSFTVSKPNGTHPFTKSPGGGGQELRSQLHILKAFIDDFDFIKMRPSNDVIKGGKVKAPLGGIPAEARVTVRVLAEAGKQYAIYIRGGTETEVVVNLPAASYRVEWVNTKTGKVEKNETIEHDGGNRALASPTYSEDIALRIKRTKKE